MAKQNTNKLNPIAKLNLYKSMIKPVLLYAGPCFGLSKHVLNQLKTIQKHVVKWILPGDSIFKEKLFGLQFLPLLL